MTLIERMYTDFISNYLLNLCHSNPILKPGKLPFLIQ